MTDARPEPDETENDAERTAVAPTTASTTDAATAGPGSDTVATGDALSEVTGMTETGDTTGSRPPAQAEVDQAEPAARPEPVWARPALPDAWGQPAPAESAPTERPFSARGSSSEAVTGPVAPDQARREESAPVGVTQPVPAAQDDGAGGTPPSDPARPDRPRPEQSQNEQSQNENQQAQNENEQAQNETVQSALLPGSPSRAEQPWEPAGAPPPYPAQYPQYTAPAGFGSPHGPEPVEAIGTAPAFGTPTGSAGAPWYVDATRPGPYGPDQPGQPQFAPGSPDQLSLFGQPDQPGQPGQPFSTSGWPPAEPFAAGGSGGRQKRRAATVVLLVGVCLLTGAIGGVAGSALYDGSTDSAGRNPTISLPAPAPVKANQGTSPVTAVAAAVTPSVVSINVKSADGAGTGSGFVINAANGYILTNNHVVTAGGTSTATSIEVIFQDGTEVPGKVVGLDASYDLAVVKVTAKGLRELELGDSDAVRVGDPVVAIGAPLGLQGTVTTGIVSALNRPVAAGEGNKPAFINAIQTDAAINPGNSGGPLVNAAGQVIAVNSAIARSPGATGASAGNIGLGFAIPSNQARRTAEQLIRTGKAEHPIIGVSLDSTYTGRGVKVIEQPSSGGGQPVTKNGPADQAGIKAGDIILKIDGRPVTEPDELIVAIRAQTPGKTITLTVLRGNDQSEVRVKLSASTD